MAGETPDFVNTGTDQGVPAPSGQGQSAPPVDPNNPAGNNTGVSVPPNDAITTSQQEPPHPPQTQTPPVNAQVQPSGPQQAPAQTMPQLPPVPKGVDPNNPNAYHPAVQRAGVWRTIAEALIPPHYNVKINPNTGETEYTKLPLSRADIGMALAAEALGGAAAGLGVKPGPGNLGRAAAAGYGQIQQQTEEANKRQLDQATQDYARHAQVLETNMRMWNNAKQVGQKDFETNQAYVQQFAPLITKIQNDYPGVITDIVSEGDLAAHHVTKDGAIPYKTVPRIDAATGKQATDQFGAPQWDTQYAIVDPHFKAEDLLTPEDKALAAKYHLQGFVDGNGKPVKLPDNLSLSLNMVTNIKSRISALKLAEGEFDDYTNNLKEGSASGPGDGKSIFSLYNNDPSKLADFITQHEGGKPEDRNTRNNNPGNLVADVSWSGPKDDTKLPPGQAPFRKYDSPEAGRQALINQIQLEQSRNPNMTPEQFFDKYDHNDAASYAQAARQYAGSAGGTTTPEVTGSPINPIDLKAAIASDPTLPDALDRAQPYFINAKDPNGGGLSAGMAAFAKADIPNGDSNYKKVMALLGGPNQVAQYDRNVGFKQQQVKDAEKASLASTELKNKQGQDDDVQGRVRSILQGPADFAPPSDAINMTPKDLRSYLESHHAGVDEKGLAPDTLEYLQGVAKYDLALGTSPVRVWAKGSPRELDQQQAAEYIRKFINPNYSTQASKTWNEWNDAGNKSAGQIIYNAGVATDHLDLLREAGAALRNGNTAYLNRIGNEFSLKLEGQKAPAQFQAIADAASREVSKVAAGQATPYAHEIESSREVLNRDYSPEAINGVIDSYTKLMGARVGEADGLVSRQTGRHLDTTISPSATSAFQRAGQATPWVVGQLPKGQGAALNDPNVLKQYYQAAGGNTKDPAKQQQAIQLATQWARKNGWNVPDPTGQGAPAPAPVQQQSPTLFHHTPPSNEDAEVNNSAAQ